MRETKRETVCVCVRERDCVCERERDCVCVRERDCVRKRDCVCERERETVCVCVRERERGRGRTAKFGWCHEGHHITTKQYKELKNIRPTCRGMEYKYSPWAT